MVEQGPFKPLVTGSSPVRLTLPDTQKTLQFVAGLLIPVVAILRYNFSTHP